MVNRSRIVLYYIYSLRIIKVVGEVGDVSVEKCIYKACSSNSCADKVLVF